MIIRACLAAFSSFHDKIPGAEWNERRDWSEEDTIECSFVYFKKLVKNILELLPEPQKEDWDVDEIVFGFTDFNLFWLTQQEEENEKHEQDPEKAKKLALKVVYEDWFLSSVAISEPLDSCLSFSRFFQNLQVRTASEAFCETVGSVMKMKGGRGRNLTPANMSAEVCLDINLGPQHLLEPMIEKIYYLRKKEYHFKLLKSGLFASKDLKEYKLGAAVRGRRLKEEKVSKLPIQVWARWAELTK